MSSKIDKKFYRIKNIHPVILISYDYIKQRGKKLLLNVVAIMAKLMFLPKRHPGLTDGKALTKSRHLTLNFL